MIKLGSLYQKAGPRLTGFVFGCTCIVIVLLYSMVLAEDKGKALVSLTFLTNYSNDF
jgi:hypothetical protein